MTSFQAKIEKNKESHAYILGVEAYYRNAALIGPFERGSEADKEWLDGYLDAAFLGRL